MYPVGNDDKKTPPPQTSGSTTARKPGQDTASGKAKEQDQDQIFHDWALF